MSQLNQVGGNIQPQPIHQPLSSHEADVPAELRGVRPSGWAIAGRVLAGIVTVGISEGVRAIVRSVRAGKASEPRVSEAGIPEAKPQADVANRNLMQAVKQNTLSPQYQAAFDEALTELRAHYGKDVLPEGTTLENMPGRSALNMALESSIHAAEHEVTPEALRTLLLEKGAPLMAERVLTGRIGEYCASIGYEEAQPADIICQNVLRKNPKLAADLQTCADSTAANAIIEPFMRSIQEDIALGHTLSTARNQANQHALTELARRTGLSEETIHQQTSFRKLNEQLTYLDGDIRKGERPLRGDDLTKAFIDVANKFVEAKAKLFMSVDTLPLSQSLKDEWKKWGLNEDTLSKGDMFTTFHAVGSSVDARNLLEALNAPAGEFSDREILGLMESLGANVTTSLVNHYTMDGWSELGGDGQGNARFYAVQAMLDAVPGLMTALASRTDLVARLMDMASDDYETGNHLSMSTDRGMLSQGLQLMASSLAAQAMLLGLLPPSAKHNDSVAASLGKPDMPPAHTLALDSAIAGMREKFGADSLPAGGAKEVLRAWDRQTRSNLSGLLATALRASTSSVDSAQFAAMFEDKAKGVAAYGAFQSVLGEMAQKSDLHMDSSNIAAVASVLTNRHPDLLVLLSRTENREGVAELLTHLPEAAVLLRVEHDIQTSWNNGMENIYAGMAATTGLSTEEVRERLDVGPVGQGGRFGYLRSDIRDLCGNPETGMDDMPSSEKIRNDFQHIVDGFIAGKAGLYTSIDGLGLSPDLTARWKAEVLTNPTLRAADFLSKCVDVAHGMSDNGLLAALSDPHANDEEILGLFRATGEQLDIEAHVVFSNDQFRDFGSDELGALNSHAQDAFFDLHPGLVAAMKANPERMRTLIALGGEQVGAIHPTTLNSPEGVEYISIVSALSIINTVMNSEE